MRLKSLLLAAFASVMIVPLQAYAMKCPTAVRGKLSAALEGRRVFLEFNCSGCHGDKAAGAWGPNIQGGDQGDLQQAVLHGDAKEGGMPSFAGCATITDVKNLAAYLRSIGTKNEPTWLDWWNLIP
jgi:mono/diheme cytochrome c family protein